MTEPDGDHFDERLLAIIAIGGLVVLAVFLSTPVLRPYYALLMPTGIVLAAGGAWYLLRGSR